MKNLSKLINDESNPVTPEQSVNSIDYEGLLFGLAPDQSVLGEARKESVIRTLRFFENDLPARIVSVIQSRPTLLKRLEASLVSRKTMVNLLTSIDASGRLVSLYQEEELVFFDENAISLLVELAQAEIDAEVDKIKRREAQIYILCETEEKNRRFLIRTLQMACWRQVALSLPRPTPKVMPAWPTM